MGILVAATISTFGKHNNVRCDTIETGGGREREIGAIQSMVGSMYSMYCVPGLQYSVLGGMFGEGFQVPREAEARHQSPQCRVAPTAGWALHCHGGAWRLRVRSLPGCEYGLPNCGSRGWRVDWEVDWDKTGEDGERGRNPGPFLDRPPSLACVGSTLSPWPCSK